MAEHEKKLNEQKEEFEEKLSKINVEYEGYKISTQTQIEKKDREAKQYKNIQKIFIEIGKVVKEMLEGRDPP